MGISDTRSAVAATALLLGALPQGVTAGGVRAGGLCNLGEPV